jgi:hypothetical protein
MKMYLFLIKQLAMKMYGRGGGIAMCILNPGTSWRAASCPSCFTSRCKSPQYPTGRRLGKSQSQSGHNGKEKKSHHFPFRELNPGHPASTLISILTELTQLPL